MKTPTGRMQRARFRARERRKRDRLSRRGRQDELRCFGADPHRCAGGDYGEKRIGPAQQWDANKVATNTSQNLPKLANVENISNVKANVRSGIKFPDSNTVMDQ